MPIGSLERLEEGGVKPESGLRGAVGLADSAGSGGLGAAGVEVDPVPAGTGVDATVLVGKVEFGSGVGVTCDPLIGSDGLLLEGGLF